MDYLIQKVTELGIKEIIPFSVFSYCPSLEESRKLKRRHRWEKITIEASKQCGRRVVPMVKPVLDYA